MIDCCADAAGRCAGPESYPNARKLFQVADTPIGVMTFGLGNIGNRSIEALVLTSRTRRAAPVEWIARTLRSREGAYPASSVRCRTSCGRARLLRRGMHSRRARSRRNCSFLPRDRTRSSEIDLFGRELARRRRAVHTGSTRARRVRDPPRLAEKGLTEEDIAAVLEPEGLETQVLFDGMPLQDAINFAVYILEHHDRLDDVQRAPACGRPSRSPLSSPDHRFRLVAKPELTVQA